MLMKYISCQNSCGQVAMTISVIQHPPPQMNFTNILITVFNINTDFDTRRFSSKDK